MNLFYNLVLKNKNSLIHIIIIFFLLTFLFSLSFKYRLSIDSYSMVNGFFDYAGVSTSGRPFISIISWVLSIFGLNYMSAQKILNILALLLFSISIYEIVVLFLKFKNDSIINRTISTGVALLVIMNPFSAELFYYNWSIFPFALSIFFVTTSLNFFFSDNDKWKNKYILTFIFFLFSLLTYQSWAPYFIVLGSIFILWGIGADKNLKNQLSKILLLFIIFVFAWILDFSYIKLIHPLLYPYQPVVRMEYNGIFESIKILLRSLGPIFVDSFLLIPKYIYIIGIGLLLSIYLLINRLNYKNIIKFGLLVFILLMALFASAIPVLLTSKGWFVPRSMLIIGSLWGIISLVIILDSGFYLSSKVRNISNLTKNLFLCLLIILTFISVFTINTVISNQIQVNSADKTFVTTISNRILEYERDTNIRIDNLYIHNDIYPQWCYEYTKCFGDLNIRSMVVSWARRPLFNNYFPRSINIIDMDDFDYEKYFKNIDYQYLNLDLNLKFKNNNAYLVIY